MAEMVTLATSLAVERPRLDALDAALQTLDAASAPASDRYLAAALLAPRALFWRRVLRAWERGQTNLPDRAAALAKMQEEDLRVLAGYLR